MDKRSVLAIVLCVVIMIGWMWLQQKIWPPPKPVPPPPKPAPTAQAPKPDEKTTPKPETTQAPSTPATSYPDKPPFMLSSKFLDVTFTNKGAGVQKVLLHYPGPDKSVPILDNYDLRWPHLALRAPGLDEIEKLPWEIVDQKDTRAEFRYRLKNGIEITKEFVLDPETHTIKLTILLDNKNPVPDGKKEPPEQTMSLELLAFNGLDPDNPYRYEQYLMGVHRYDGKLDMKATLPNIEKGEGKLADALKAPAGESRDKDVKSIEDDYFKVNGGHKEWFGLRNRFFVAIVNPDDSAKDLLDGGSYQFRLLPPDANNPRKNITAAAKTKSFEVGGSRRIIQFTAWAGPLKDDALKEIPGATDLSAYSGGCLLAPIVKPAAAVILELLRICHAVLRNWGLGIIATTLLIRLCLFPLSLKSQRSALQMQQLQPKLQALKERYKDDQQKYGIEQMRLFREHKINPFSGCLPLFIQMPIFVGMYSVFEMSIDLRGAPFMLWIRDLSQPDQLMGGQWGIQVPLLITTLRIDALNLLPILMTITWFLQAYLSPRSPDPQMAQQQKMMMYMPIIFGLTCYGLASGLSLYFLVNSLLGMAEQKIIKKYILKIPPGGPGAAPAMAGK